MNSIINIVLCLSCVYFVGAAAYKAGAIHSTESTNEILAAIQDAGKEGVDILVLPALPDSEENYEKTMKDLSTAAKEANLYLVANLKENIRCQGKLETIRSDLVFDRQGVVIADYRKSDVTNCTSPVKDVITFVTDFGVRFGLMMEEDLVMKSGEELKGLKNVVVTAGKSSHLPLLSAPQFFKSWVYMNKVNLVSSSGIYSGKDTVEMNRSLVTAVLQNNGDDVLTPPIVDISTSKVVPTEDLSQYIIKPVDTAASRLGYKDTVCHNNFCCEFDVKMEVGEQSQDIVYGLAAFEGVRHYTGSHYIGEQNCALVACAGAYKTCSYGSINNTNIYFERLSISANFSKDSAQYPIILSKPLPSENFHFAAKTERNIKHVTVTLTDSDSLVTFGIFGRDFSKDQTSYSSSNTDGGDFYEYIFNEDVQEFFDYIWIRLRILIVVVSIYVLEMI